MGENCSLKQHIQAEGVHFPAALRQILRNAAPGDILQGQGYSVRKFLSHPTASVIDGPNGNDVPLQGVVIQWHDPSAELCNAAREFSITLHPNQKEGIPNVVPPQHSVLVNYDLYYQTEYTVTVESSNADGSQSSQNTFRTSTQPTPTNLAPNGVGGIVTSSPTLSWIDPGVVPAKKYQVTVRDLVHTYIKPISVVVSQTSYQVPFQLETDTKYSWSVQGMYPGNTSFGPTAAATFTTVGNSSG